MLGHGNILITSIVYQSGGSVNDFIKSREVLVMNNESYDFLLDTW